MRGRRCFVFFCVALAALVAAGCSKKKSADDESSEPTAAFEKPAEKEKAVEFFVVAGFGSINGTVAFAGKASDAKDLLRKVDPVCVAKSMKDNEVIVNSNNILKDVLVRVAFGAVKNKFN